MENNNTQEAMGWCKNCVEKKRKERCKQYYQDNNKQKNKK